MVSTRHKIDFVMEDGNKRPGDATFTILRNFGSISARKFVALKISRTTDWLLGLKLTVGKFGTLSCPLFVGNIE